MDQSGSGAATAAVGGGRLWNLQWIRGYAMLLGIPFHVGLIYSFGTPWFVTSPEKSAIVTAITGWLTSFRMPLFFYVAGLLSAAAMCKRGPRAWMKRRLERLGVPLVTATFVIGPMIFAAMAYASRGPGFRQFRTVFQQFLLRPGGHWVGHLWFLQVLLIYSVLAVFSLPTILRLKPRLIRRDAEGRFAIPSAWVFGVAVAIAAYLFVDKGLLAFARSHGFKDPLWEMLKVEDVVDFLPYFLIGLVMHEVRLPAIHRSVWAWSIIGLSMVFFADHWNEPALSDKAIRYVCESMLAVLGGSMILVLSARLVTENAPRAAFLADSSFTVFLVHYPIVVWLGTLFRDIHWEPLVEYLLLISITLALSLLVHVGVSRSRVLTYLFNGARRGAQPTAPASRPAEALVVPSGVP